MGKSLSGYFIVMTVMFVILALVVSLFLVPMLMKKANSGGDNNGSYIPRDDATKDITDSAVQLNINDDTNNVLYVDSDDSDDTINATNENGSLMYSTGQSPYITKEFLEYAITSHLIEPNTLITEDHISILIRAYEHPEEISGATLVCRLDRDLSVCTNLLLEELNDAIAVVEEQIYISGDDLRLNYDLLY